jgi:hypothetical protein
MDDRNHWYEYLLARDPQDPKQYPGLSRYSTNLLPKSSHQYPREADDQFATFDSNDKVRSRQRYAGVEWKHEFGDGWSLNQNVKFSRNWADWNSSAGVTPRSLEWPNFFSNMLIQFSGGGTNLNGRVPPETLKGKVIFIAVNAESIKDITPTPLNAVSWGVDIHAHTVDQIIRAATLGHTPTLPITDSAETLWILLWTVLGALAGLFARRPMNFSLLVL